MRGEARLHRSTRARVLCRFTILAAVAALAVPVFAAGSTSAAGPPTLTLVPPTDLVDFSSINLSGSGFVPGEQVQLRQCSASQCQWHFTPTTADANGDIANGFNVQTARLLVPTQLGGPGGSFSCLSQSCFLVAFRGGDDINVGTLIVGTPLWFRNSGGSVAGRAISVSPQTGLPAVQQVNVSGTSFYTGYLPVRECTGVYPLLACSAPLVTFADVAGSFGPVQYTAQREFDAVNVVYHVNCVDPGSAPNGCFITADQGVVGSPYWIYAVQPLSFATAAYPFTGFFQPVDNGGVLNVVKAGRSVPVKFSLGGDRGLGILAAGYPQSRVISCANQATDQVEETTSSNSGLSYDATADQYIYVWSTDKSWAGQCRQLSVKLTDGTVHTANFQLT